MLSSVRPLRIIDRSNRIGSTAVECLRSAKLFLSFVPLPIELLQDCSEGHVSVTNRIVEFQSRPDFGFSLGDDVNRGQRTCIEELHLGLRHRRMGHRKVGLLRDCFFEVLN